MVSSGLGEFSSSVVPWIECEVDRVYQSGAFLSFLSEQPLERRYRCDEPVDSLKLSQRNHRFRVDFHSSEPPPWNRQDSFRAALTAVSNLLSARASSESSALEQDPEYVLVQIS